MEQEVNQNFDIVVPLI